MRRSTLALLRCPTRKNCGGELNLETEVPISHSEVNSGSLVCKKCKTAYPILEGVAILVPKVRDYLLAHVKGLSRVVPDHQIPKPFLREYQAYRKELGTETGLEEDLESERVNALYLMNHYLKTTGSPQPWWKNVHAAADPLIDELIQKYWDRGPLETVSQWVEGQAEIVELGCGVGGLFRRLPARSTRYLGVDNAFQSILLARHFNLGIPMKQKLKIPGDLLQGGVSQDFPQLNPIPKATTECDFIVGEIEAPPISKSHWDLSISLNAIDMLEDPRLLPKAQSEHLKQGGFAIQSGPYIWNESVSKRLRAQLPKEILDSARAVKWLFEKSGFKITRTKDSVPWLFFKHYRQLELYSVHVLMAQKK